MSRILHEGEKVFTVSAFLVQDKISPRVLLRKHPKLGLWLQPGGHIESHQDPIQALIVEFMDEVGVDLAPYLKPLGVHGRVTVLPRPHHLTVIEIPADKPNPGDPAHFMVDMGFLIHATDEYLHTKGGQELAWVRRNQLKDFHMPEDVRVFLEKHL